MFRIAAAVLAACVLASSARAQFEVTEVLPNPSAGSQIIELTNVTAANQDAGGWFICWQFLYYEVPSPHVLAPGASVRIHVNANGIDSATDLFMGAIFAPLGLASDAITLYVPGNGTFAFFNNDNNIADAVQYGAGFGPRMNQAVNIGEWDAEASFVPTPGVDVSIAFDGTGDAAADWFRDVSPTLGSANATAGSGAATVGTGCGAISAPVLTNVSHPAPGNQDFRLELDTSNPLQPALFWFNTGGPDFVPVHGGACTLHVPVGTPFFEFIFVTNGAGEINLPTTIPDHPALPGLTLTFQYLVANAGPFPPFDMSNGLVLTF